MYSWMFSSFTINTDYAHIPIWSVRDIRESLHVYLSGMRRRRKRSKSRAAEPTELGDNFSAAGLRTRSAMNLSAISPLSLLQTNIHTLVITLESKRDGGVSKTI